MKALFESVGYSLNDIVKTTVFVTDIDDFAAVNTIYASYFEKEPPARSFVAVKSLPKNAKIEIEAVAWKKLF